MFAFEKALVYHCSPTLSGLKPANLLSLSKRDYPHLPELAEEYSLLLSSKGIQLEIVCSCGQRWLLLVFRPQILAEQLADRRAFALLRQAGYPVLANRPLDLAALLSHLKKRLSQSEGFPHEIGLFLGYPLEDVIGFCRHKGEGCKLCGYWKVYGDVESARKSFALFDRCRELLFSHLLSGAPLQELVGEQPLAA